MVVLVYMYSVLDRNRFCFNNHLTILIILSVLNQYTHIQIEGQEALAKRESLRETEVVTLGKRLPGDNAKETFKV